MKSADPDIAIYLVNEKKAVRDINIPKRLHTITHTTILKKYFMLIHLVHIGMFRQN